MGFIGLVEALADQRPGRPRRHHVLPSAVALWFGVSILCIAYVAQALFGASLATAEPPTAALAAVVFIGVLVFISVRVMRAIL